MALARPAFGDARWSFLYGPDTRYGGAEPEDGRGRRGESPDARGDDARRPARAVHQGARVDLGGAALLLARRHRRRARRSSRWPPTSRATSGRPPSRARSRSPRSLPAPALLIADLGRPARFLNMLRIFKPRSPMNIGRVVPGRVQRRRRRRRGGRPARAAAARRAGWVRSTRCSAATSAPTPACCWRPPPCRCGRAAASSSGRSSSRPRRPPAPPPRAWRWRPRARPTDHPTRIALGRLETAAILTELTLSTVNERRLGRVGERLVARAGRAGCLRTAKALVGGGLALNLLGRRRVRTPVEHVASVLYLAGGLAFRFAWVEAGKASARDDEAVALMARGTRDRIWPGARTNSARRPPPPFATGAARSAAPASRWSACCGARTLSWVGGKKTRRSPVWWSYSNDHTGDTTGYPALKIRNETHRDLKRKGARMRAPLSLSDQAASEYAGSSAGSCSGFLARVDGRGLQHGHRDGDGRRHQPRGDAEREVVSAGERGGVGLAAVEQAARCDSSTSVARTASPIAPPTCRLVFTRPDARPESLSVAPDMASVAMRRERRGRRPGRAGPSPEGRPPGSCRRPAPA